MAKLISGKQVLSSYNMSEIITAIESAYVQLNNGKVIMPDRQFIPTENGGDIMDAPAYLLEDKVFGLKVSSYSPGNLNTNLPTLHGIVPLFDGETGQVLALVDSVSITALRTGAKSAIAVRYLARENSSTLGILGMGTQAKSHAEAISKVRDIKKVLLWTRDLTKHEDFVAYIKNNLKLEVEVLASPDQVAKQSDILVDATWSTKPLVKTNSIKEGTLVIGLFHSPDAIQFGSELLAKSRVYIDYKNNTHAGTVKSYYSKTENLPVFDLAQVITSGKDLRVKDNEYVYFHSSGLSIEDVAAAYAVFKNLDEQVVEFNF